MQNVKIMSLDIHPLLVIIIRIRSKILIVQHLHDFDYAQEMYLPISPTDH